MDNLLKACDVPFFFPASNDGWTLDSGESLPVTEEGIRRGVSLGIFRIGRLIYRSNNTSNPKKITYI
jgi:hypothetical protein